MGSGSFTVLAMPSLQHPPANPPRHRHFLSEGQREALTALSSTFFGSALSPSRDALRAFARAFAIASSVCRHQAAPSGDLSPPGRCGGLFSALLATELKRNQRVRGGVA